MKKLLVLKNGCPPEGMRSVHGDFEDQLVPPTGFSRREAVVADMVRQEALPEPGDLAGIIISGSLAMVSDREPWMEAEAAWLREMVRREVPTLGVCFGHQMLAYALGGRVGYNPRGAEMGTVTVVPTERAADDALFRDLPSPLTVQASHSQSAIELPDAAVLLARNAHDPHHAFRIGECAWGVQFHPEWDAAITRLGVELSRAQLLQEGQDVEALLAGCRETPEAALIMARFGDIVRARMC